MVVDILYGIIIGTTLAMVLIAIDLFIEKYNE
jgi:tetrahydromethanopterin S-methyltransferase subunit G